jgi:hypothetical protein
VNRPLVYIACPLTKGNRNWNYYQAHEAESKLMLAGFAPQNPAHTIVLPFSWDVDYPYDMWLDCCFPLIARMDAVLRLPGYSVGADAECTHAEKCGVPVFYDIESLEKWKEERESVLCQ